MYLVSVTLYHICRLQLVAKSLTRNRIICFQKTFEIHFIQMRASCQCDSSAFFCPLSYSSATRIGKLCSVINKFICKGKLVEAWSYENRNGNYRFMGRLLCCETSATIDNMIGVDFLSMYGMTSVPFDECDQVDALHNFVILELF